MANHYAHIYSPSQWDIFYFSHRYRLKFPRRFGELPITNQLGTSGDLKATDTVQNDYNLSPYTASSTDLSPPSLIAFADVPDDSPRPPLLPDSPDLVHSSSGQSQKGRKEKQRIELAPDQPPTTQGRRRARVFVACVQCRGRKIRCDGAKPVCYHCSQRDDAEQCSYDALPKRRGPDRIQGARTRGTKPKEDGEPRRRRRHSATTEQAAGGGSYGIRRSSVTPKPSTLDILADATIFAHTQQNAVVPHAVGLDEVDLLESSVLFSSTASSSRILALESTSHGHPPVVVERDYADATTFQSGAGASFDGVVPTYGVLGGNIHQLESRDITTDPSMEFTRKIWWDHLLDVYASFAGVSYSPPHLGLAQRDGTVSQIIKDTRFIFRSSHYWFSFLNVPRFFNNFADPVRRSRMQPSLLLSLLAVSTFLQSPGRENPTESRRMAVLLRDEAQGYLEASLYARAIDEELAQAAWILSFFEVCAHPQHQMTRIHASLNTLDSIIRSLALSYLDANDPTASTFTRDAVPVVAVSSEQYLSPPQPYFGSISMPSLTPQYVPQQQLAVNPNVRAASCPCDSLSLGFQWPEAQTQVPLWVATPMWNREWSEGEIKKEECRRLCWSALMLVTGHTSFATAVNWRNLDLFMVEPSNYSILFPGESLLRSQAQRYVETIGGKHTVWALYLRAMLLWNACVRMRHDPSFSDLDRGNFAMRAWLETEAIEEALQWHTCSIERAFMFNGREYLFNTRMCISYDFQRFIPYVFIGMNRNKSEEWLRAQERRAKTIKFAMHAVTGNNKHSLAQRPWFMWWFMGQIYRALTLWQHDNSLTIALDVCKAFIEPIEYLIKLYPGSVQNLRLDELRERLRLALLTAEAASEYIPTPIDML